MDPAREVVITGLGVVSPIGVGYEAFWSSLLQRQSGVGPITLFDARLMPVAFGAELKDFDAKLYVKPRKALKVMCRELQTGVAAANLAVEHAELAPGQVTPERIGTVFGSEMFYGDVQDLVDVYQASREGSEFSFARYAAEFPSRMYPLWMLKNLPNMAACHVAIAQDARGPSNTIVSGEVSGLLALIEAVRIIERDLADVMIVGATGTRIGLTGWIYRGDLGLSHRSDNPQGASRPFDADRDGMVNGEGAAALVVETRDHARRRGANVLASIVGGASFTATRRDVPSFCRALQLSLQAALAQAGWRRGDVGHVNAHGLSGLEADEAEALAIREALGDLPVTALKSYFGNVGPAGSLLELIGSVLALQHDRIPVTLNYTTPDPRCPVRVVHDDPLENRIASALKISFSSTGQAAVLAVHR
jgi:3-oxoacyl-[acyl-carrier-protein] synthase II